LNNNVNVDGEMTVTQNTTLSTLIVSSDSGVEGDHIALFENTGGGGADGIAIKIDNAILSSENHFVTFYGQGNSVVGRIESFDASSETLETFPTPDFNTLYEAFDFSMVQQGGILPSLSFNQGTLPTSIFDAGVLPGIIFDPGAITLPSLNGGSLPTINFDPGAFTLPSLTGGTLPSAIFDPGSFGTFSAGSLPTAVFSPGSFGTPNFSPGTLPTASFSVGSLPSIDVDLIRIPPIIFSSGSLPSLTFSGGSLPTLTFDGLSLPSLAFNGGSLPSFDFSTATLPSLSFNTGSLPSFNPGAITLPTLTFDGGSLPTLNPGAVTLPSLNFVPGTLSSLTFTPGTLPTAALNPGEFPTLDFTGIFDPIATIGAQGQMNAVADWSARNGSSGFFPADPWQLEVTSVILDAKALAQNQGIVYGSKGADYAEWLEKENLEDNFTFGEVVGIKGGKISRNTEDADHILTISLAPIVLGNMPEEDRKEAYEKVGFMGQVPALVVGNVSEGDYIVASGNNDGFAVAIAPEDISLSDLKSVIGKAWSSSKGKKISIINVSVGLKSNEWVKILELQEDRLTEVETQLKSMKILSEKIEAKMKTLEIN